MMNFTILDRGNTMAINLGIIIALITKIATNTNKRMNRVILNIQNHNLLMLTVLRIFTTTKSINMTTIIETIIKETIIIVTTTVTNLYIIAVQKILTIITITIIIIGMQIVIIIVAIEIVTIRLQWCRLKWTLKITTIKIVIKIVMTNKCRDSTRASTIIMDIIITKMIIKTNMYSKKIQDSQGII